eukprot:6976838-Alexandrium_andersonii.AAC.1
MCRVGPALAPTGPCPGILEGVRHWLGGTAGIRRPAAHGGHGRLHSCPVRGGPARTRAWRTARRRGPAPGLRRLPGA